MDVPLTEIKRKIFHHLALVYMAMYAALPRWWVLSILFVVLCVLAVGEFLRLRRPELNAWLLGKFGGIHRTEEIMHPSGIFWTLLGSWLTMFIFTSRGIVFAALGILAFADAAAALGGKKWGKRPWPHNPQKTIEGSACFAAVAIGWSCFFVYWPVAIAGSLAAAWIESRKLPWNDGVWVPLMSGLILSVLNLVIGK